MVVHSAAAWTVRDLGQEWSFLCVKPDGPHVRRGDNVRLQHLDLNPGGTLSERRDPRVCLGIDRSSNARRLQMT
jgi:hypothetical protein